MLTRFYVPFISLGIGAIFMVLVLPWLSQATSDVPENNVQIFAPDGRKTEALTGASVTKDMSKWRVWRVTSTTAWKRKHAATEAGLATAVQVDVDAGVSELGVNKATPFTNISSATGALEGM